MMLIRVIYWILERFWTTLKTCVLNSNLQRTSSFQGPALLQRDRKTQSLPPIRWWQSFWQTCLGAQKISYQQCPVGKRNGLICIIIIFITTIIITVITTIITIICMYNIVQCPYWLLKVVVCPSIVYRQRERILDTSSLVRWYNEGQFRQVHLSTWTGNITNQLQMGLCNHEVTFGHTLPHGNGSDYLQKWMVSDPTNNNTHHLGYPIYPLVPQSLGLPSMAKDSTHTAQPVGLVCSSHVTSLFLSSQFLMVRSPMLSAHRKNAIIWW